jgi:hypothetical protein
LRSGRWDQSRLGELLLSGKTGLADAADLQELHASGLLVAGEFVPAIYRDPKGLRAAIAQLPAI